MSKAGNKKSKIDKQPSDKGIQKPSVLQTRTKALQQQLKDLSNGPLSNASPATISQWLKMIEKIQKQADTFNPQLESYVDYDAKAQENESKKEKKDKKSVT